MASATGTTTKTRRFYQQIALLPPADRGRRLLHLLHTARAGVGLTLTHIRDVLHVRDGGDPACEHVRRLLQERLRALDTQIAELHALRETLLELSSSSSAVEPRTCHAEEVCRYL